MNQEAKTKLEEYRTKENHNLNIKSESGENIINFEEWPTGTLFELRPRDLNNNVSSTLEVLNESNNWVKVGEENNREQKIYRLPEIQKETITYWRIIDIIEVDDTNDIAICEKMEPHNT